MICLVLAGTASADSASNLADRMAANETAWKKIHAQIRSKDKTFCDAGQNQNLTTCARAYALSQTPETAGDLLNAASGFLSASLADSKSKALDEATALISAFESLLIYKKSLMSGGFLCSQTAYLELHASEKTTTACQKDLNLRAKTFASWTAQIKNGLVYARSLIAKSKLAAPAKTALEERVKVLEQDYQAVMDAPLPEGAPSGSTASSPNTNKIQMLVEEFKAAMLQHRDREKECAEKKKTEEECAKLRREYINTNADYIGRIDSLSQSAADDERAPLEQIKGVILGEIAATQKLQKSP